MDPISEVVLEDKEYSRVHVSLGAQIKETGDLQLVGCDMGEFPE